MVADTEVRDELDDWWAGLLARDPHLARVYAQVCAAAPRPLCIDGREYARRQRARRRRKC